MNRREQIVMDEHELAAFVRSERTLTCATIGPRGWPHLMPLWYVVREPAARLWAWTYAASQKVRNLERDARATVQIEAGQSYEELRGAMLECEVRIHRDPTLVAAFGRELFARYGAPPGEPPLRKLHPEVEAMVVRQAGKRVALEFVELRRASWDHRKLGAHSYPAG